MSRFSDNDYEPDGAWPTPDMYFRNERLAIECSRGQAALRELAAALEALPSKRLIEGALACKGDVCTVGALVAYKDAQAKGIDIGEAIRLLDHETTQPHLMRDPDDTVEGQHHDDKTDEYETTMAEGQRVGLTKTLTYALSNMNDEDFALVTPEERYEKVVAWVRKAILAEPRKPERRPKREKVRPVFGQPVSGGLPW